MACTCRASRAPTAVVLLARLAADTTPLSIPGAPNPATLRVAVCGGPPRRPPIGAPEKAENIRRASPVATCFVTLESFAGFVFVFGAYPRRAVASRHRSLYRLTTRATQKRTHADTTTVRWDAYRPSHEVRTSTTSERSDRDEDLRTRHSVVKKRKLIASVDQFQALLRDSRVRVERADDALILADSFAFLFVQRGFDRGEVRQNHLLKRIRFVRFS